MASRVSVIVPAYNSSSTICRAVDSALMQPETVEVIVLDDGSSDCTWDVVRTRPIWGSSYQENLGQAVRRNMGVEMATADYVAFLDADDRWEKGKLGKQLAVMRATRSDFCYTWMYSGQEVYRDCHGQVRHAVVNDCPVSYSSYPAGELLDDCVMGRRFYSPSTWIIKRDQFLGFNPRLKGVEDWDYAIRAAETSSVACVLEPLVDYQAPTGFAKWLEWDVPRQLTQVVLSTANPLAGMLGRACAHALAGLMLMAAGHYQEGASYIDEGYEICPTFFWHTSGPIPDLSPYAVYARKGFPATVHAVQLRSGQEDFPATVFEHLSGKYLPLKERACDY